MSSRTRLIVMSISAPVIAFAIVGGFLGKVMAGQDAPYQHLKIFDDVVTMISSQYVEEVNIDKVMNGAMHGLADGLDPDSAYLTAAQVKQVEAGTPLPPAGVGLELTRQYYLRVIAARDNSPAAKAGLRTGDYIRAINDLPTREMSVWEGTRMLRGAAGTKVTVTVIRGNAADPHVVELVRQAEAERYAFDTAMYGEHGTEEGEENPEWNTRLLMAEFFEHMGRTPDLQKARESLLKMAEDIGNNPERDGDVARSTLLRQLTRRVLAIDPTALALGPELIARMGQNDELLPLYKLFAHYGSREMTAAGWEYVNRPRQRAERVWYLHDYVGMLLASRALSSEV